VVVLHEVLGIDEGSVTAGLLRRGHGVKRHRGLTGGLRSVDLDDAATRWGEAGTVVVPKA
ncbi:MAG: hypothetical protein Q605_AUC01143G0001, partial [Actinomyces urogenitalis DORA_12]